MRVFVVNAGSSTLKLAVVENAETAVDEWALPAPPPDELAGVIDEAVARAGTVDAVGHRIVHGGPGLLAPTIVTDAIRTQLAAATELAPLHNPPALAALDEVRRSAPEIPSVACFDTAFHSTLPQAAAVYALPAAWTDRWPLRRFGFHGLSHAWVARRTRALLADEPPGRIVSCHLGAGASLAAIADGRSVDTTMGFTPLDGLIMATRPGSLDPGLLLWAQRHGPLTVDEAEYALEHEAGLLGLSRSSGDMRAIIAAADNGDAPAQLALDAYAHRLRAGIAAMAAAMEGLDALVFTGGVGERAPSVRAAAAAGLGFLGVAVDGARNDAALWDSRISPDGAPVTTIVVRAREDIEIACETEAVIS